MPDILDTELREALGAEVPDGLAYREEYLRQIRSRVAQRSHRRAAMGVAAACIVAASAIALPQLLSPSGEEKQPDVATGGLQGEQQPAPWSDVEVPDDREGDDWFVVPGTAYLVADGTAGTARWLATSSDLAADSHGCIFVRSEALFRSMQASCFDTWRTGQTSRHFQFVGDRDAQYAVIAGAVSTDARSVTLTFSDGRTTSVAAVATPTSGELRFFAVAVATPARLDTVLPIDAQGQVAPPPPDLPWSVNCDEGCPTQPAN